MRRPTLALLATLAGATAAPAQDRAVPHDSAAMGPQAPADARAVRARRAPVLDGRMDDDAWREAPPIRAFRQFDPSEDGEPSERTEARVAYDDRNLYVFVRAYDRAPDSIRTMLGRRDAETASDKIRVILDPYLDRRTGVQMDVNPAGVRRDASMYDDVEDDQSWDGVWDVATLVDSLGWTAEFRIPLSQLRFTPGPTLRFGLGIWREIARRNERIGWPVYRPSRRAHVSQLGVLGGLVGVPAPQRLEVLPYVVARNESELRDERWGRAGELSVGGDLKYGVTPTLTLDATINPDFGQVEADPAVLNLGPFEQQFEERRPFFLEGVGLFRCGGPCEGIFYTRRIGRSPQLRRDDLDPAASTILGAAKLTGRVARGTSVGLVDAVTDREVGRDGGTVEPRTNYLVGRAYQELRGGRSGAGLMLTGVNRELDEVSAPVLRREAYTLLGQGFHRFARERYEVMGYVGLNHVAGSREAIARTQLGSVHFYQRPDGFRFDSTRTTLGGAVKSLQLRKLDGAVTFHTNLRHADPGVELNDLGFVTNVNEMSARNTINARTRRPGRGYRRLEAELETYNSWTVDGLPSGGRLELNGEMELPSAWEIEVGSALENARATYCTTCARGGPSVRRSPATHLSLELRGNRQRAVTPYIETSFQRSDVGRSRSASAEVGAQLRASSRLDAYLELEGERKRDDRQWVDNFGDPLSDTTHFTFARLGQSTLSATARATLALTSALSVQVYAQPFVSAGKYADWRELADPRAGRYEDRYQPYGGGAVPEGFNEKAFNSNVVLRWEYRPGSVLFAVWQQGREQDHLDPGSFDALRDARNLFSAHPRNTFLVKGSWWFNP
ncbi:MAG: DUF5916 domain-containing protein [Gemmatimonadaceae bacterium]